MAGEVKPELLRGPGGEWLVRTGESRELRSGDWYLGVVGCIYCNEIDEPDYIREILRPATPEEIAAAGDSKEERQVMPSDSGKTLPGAATGAARDAETFFLDWIAPDTDFSKRSKNMAVAFAEAYHAMRQQSPQRIKERAALAAIEIIARNDDSCQCDHSDKNCCVKVGTYCAHCTAEIALAVVSEASPDD